MGNRGRKSKWAETHAKDPFVRLSRQNNYRSRAAYKLLEIQQRDRLIQPKGRILDLGASPGSWSQVASKLVGSLGLVVAVDRLPMKPIGDVRFIEGDIESAETIKQLRVLSGKEKFDVVLSDMAPNLTGIRITDQANAERLASAGLEFALESLSPTGSFLLKVFEGTNVGTIKQQFSRYFKRLLTRKPRASRSDSREFYLLGRGLIANVSVR